MLGSDTDMTAAGAASASTLRFRVNSNGEVTGRRGGGDGGGGGGGGSISSYSGRQAPVTLTAQTVARAVARLRERGGSRYCTLRRALQPVGGPTPNFLHLKAALLRARKQGLLRQNAQGRWTLNTHSCRQAQCSVGREDVSRFTTVRQAPPPPPRHSRPRPRLPGFGRGRKKKGKGTGKGKRKGNNRGNGKGKGKGKRRQRRPPGGPRKGQSSGRRARGERLGGRTQRRQKQPGPRPRTRQGKQRSGRLMATWGHAVGCAGMCCGLLGYVMLV